MDFVTNKLRVIKNENGEIMTYKIEILHQYLMEDDLSAPQLIDNTFLLNILKLTDIKDGIGTAANGIYDVKL